MENTFHMRLYRAFHAQRSYLRSFLGNSGLGNGQPKLLVYLDSQGPCSQRELAEYFEIDPSAVSRMLYSMEKGGFITRKTNQESRRSDLIGLTEQGERFAKLWRENYQKMEELLLKGFTEEEQKQFQEYLSRAYQNFCQYKGEKSCVISKDF